MVAIIDDREDVWGPRCPNLVHVKPYIFFANTADINAPPPLPTPPPGTPPTPTGITPHVPPLTQAQAPPPIGLRFPPQQVPFKTRHFSRTNKKFRPPQTATSGTFHQPQVAKERADTADLEETAKREGHTVLESLLLAGQPNHQDSHLHLHQGHVHQLEISHTYAHTNKSDNAATEATPSSDKPSDPASQVPTTSDTASGATLSSTTITKDAASVPATETTRGDVVRGGNVNENNNNRTSDMGGKGSRKREGRESGSSSSSSSSSSESESEDSSSSSSGIDNTDVFETGEQHGSGEGGERGEGKGEKNGGQTGDQEENSGM